VRPIIDRDDQRSGRTRPAHTGAAK
jgi:hypothetical protein